MTIIMPQLSWADKLLRILGKKRGVIIISEKDNKFGEYSTRIASKESFFKALFRPRDEALPDGMIDIFSTLD